jgi:choline dehydrogenase-like flavoprotein
MATVFMPGQWGEEFAATMNHYHEMAGMLMIGEDLPEADNRITLHTTRKDQAGLPVPVVSYRFHPNSVAMRDYAVKVGHDIYNSLGAKQVIDCTSFPATHNMGVARMGEDPGTSVCNSWGQTHDIPNLFVSDGSLLPSSGSANPTLTIVALILRQADYIANEVKTGKI